MRLLRERQAERQAQPPYPVHVTKLDEHTFVATTDSPIDYDGPQPFPVATRITVDAGKIVAMQQYRPTPRSLQNPNLVVLSQSFYERKKLITQVELWTYEDILNSS